MVVPQASGGRQVPSMLHRRPDAHSLNPLKLAHGPVPGARWQLPLLPVEDDGMQSRSPVQPTTGFAIRSQGCPSPLCVTVLPEAQRPVVGLQKEPGAHTTPKFVHGSSIFAPAAQVPHFVMPPLQLPDWH